MSYSSITQERLPNFFLYCVAAAARPTMAAAKSLNSKYDDWFQINNMDQFVDMIQDDIHRQIARKLKFPRNGYYGILELRGPVHYYGDGVESDVAETATITFLTDHGYFKCSGSQIVGTLTKHNARSCRVDENQTLSYVEGNPLWDAFWKDPSYKCLPEYRVAYFPCLFSPQILPLDVGKIGFFSGIKMESLLVPLSWSEDDRFRSNLEAREPTPPR